LLFRTFRRRLFQKEIFIMAQKSMKAVQIRDYGGPEALEIVEVPIPQPGEGQVLVQLRAAGVNPADWKMRGGAYRQFMPLSFPWIPGLEGSGIVSKIGPGVTEFKPGQAVFGTISAAYAEYALAATQDLQPKPENLTFEQAATIPVGALTAWGAVIDAAKVQAGQRVLIQGAAGGVGVYALQLVRWKEAHAIATASTGNLDLLRTLGAEDVIDYGSTRFETVLHGLDAVIDTLGGDTPERAIKVLRPDGILVSVAGRLPPDLGKAEGMRAMSAGRAPAANLKQITALFKSGQLKAVVGKVFKLEEVRQAHELSQTGHGRGRIILCIGE
jgi:NADPH:quinone reductase-like Zn-dependent oxidoreductase